VSQDPGSWLLEPTAEASAFDWATVEGSSVPGLTILSHPEPWRVGERAPLFPLTEGRPVELSRLTPAFTQPASVVASALGDRYLTRRPLTLVPGRLLGEIHLLPPAASMEVTVDGEVLEAPLDLDAARIGDGVVLLLGRRVALLLHLLDPESAVALPRFGLVGESSGMVRLRREIQWAAQTETPVLLLGGTGTGKEMVARALHDAGPRRRRPFQAVNLGAVPATLAAAELFGAVRGAYTGAERPRSGVFEMADGGTLFLDEVGEAPREVRSALLRVLETGEVQTVGGGPSRRVDVRLIAATDRDLEAAIDDGDWSSALLHRLAGLELRLPLLRERRDDVGRLLHHFLRQELEKQRGGPVPADDGALAPPAPLVAALARHDWPGNVRELRNIARELALASPYTPRGPVGPRLRQLWRSFAERRHPGQASHRLDITNTLDLLPTSRRRSRRVDLLDTELMAALEAHRFSLKATAEALGISRTTLYQRIAASPNLHTAADLDDSEITTSLERWSGDLQAAATELRVSPEALRRRVRRLQR
jgi:two-component system nitrogen regulation response regulator GlnG